MSQNENGLAGKNRVDYCDLGVLAYDEALALQNRLHDLRVENKINNTILILEHPPVITMGIRGKENNVLADPEILKKQGVDVHQINRGGDVTYHGPGQLVLYFIFHLREAGLSIHDLVFGVEDSLIALLDKQYGIKARREDKHFTGIWVGNEKIMAAGLSVGHGVSMHGFAININTDLTHFSWINPCGIVGRGVTSLSRLLMREVSMDEFKEHAVSFLEKGLSTQLVRISTSELKEAVLGAGGV